jgi:hypothetical protein
MPRKRAAAISENGKSDLDWEDEGFETRKGTQNKKVRGRPIESQILWRISVSMP